MAKSTAFSEINKINEARKALVKQEKNIGLPVDEKMTLLSLATSLSAFDSKSYKSSYDENGWVDLNKMYENDKNLVKNGGKFAKSIYAILDTSVDETYMYAQYYSESDDESRATYYIMSDMPEGSQPIKCTKRPEIYKWDTSKDLTDALGHKYRWVAMYSNENISSMNYDSYFSYPTGSSLDGFGNQVEALVLNTWRIWGSSYDNRSSSYNNIKLLTITENIGEQQYDSYYGANFTGLKTLYVYGENTSLYATTQALEKIVLHSAYMFYLNLSGIINGDSITIPGCAKKLNIRTNCRSVIINPPNLPAGQVPKEYNISFGSAMTDLTVYKDYNYQLSLSGCDKLHKESLIGVLNNLKDLTGESSKTISIGKYNLTKLTEEEKAIATTKNWVLN